MHQSASRLVIIYYALCNNEFAMEQAIIREKAVHTYTYLFKGAVCVCVDLHNYIILYLILCMYKMCVL